MIAKNSSKNLMMKTLVAALAGLVVLAPGATALGALDASGALSATGSATANLDGATKIVDEVQGQVESTASQALATVSEIHADADIAAHADAKPAVDGAASAGTGFLATAKGYFNSFLQGIESLFGMGQATAEGAVNDAIGDVATVQGQATAHVSNSVNAASSVGIPDLPEPPAVQAPKVDASLTASLQAALAGLMAFHA